MEKWPKETIAQVRDRAWRALIETGLQDATPQERALLLPCIRDFEQRQKDKEGLEQRQKAVQRRLQVWIAIMGIIATLVVGAAAVGATLAASRSAPPIVIQAPAASSTPFPTATPH